MYTVDGGVLKCMYYAQAHAIHLKEGVKGWGESERAREGTTEGWRRKEKKREREREREGGREREKTRDRESIAHVSPN